MKHIHKIILLIIALASFAPLVSMAQNEEDLAEFLKANREDASELISAYIQPVIRGVSYGMTGGWYHTAKAHKPFGVDLGVSINMAFIPTTENYFDPTKFLTPPSTFANTSSAGSGAPTFVGPDDNTQYTTTHDPDGSGPLTSQTFTINGPQGLNLKEDIGFNAVPVPMAQVGIGLIKGTDLKIRFVPERKYGGSEIKMFGIGIMHDVKQYIPGIKMLPFDLSALVAYNKVNGTTDLRNSNANDSKPDSNDGETNYEFKSWVIQGILSKKISILTAYVGVGYNMVKSNAAINGTYTISASPQSFNITNPLSIEFKNNSARITAGIRLKFGPLYLNTDYTLQKYNVWSTGIGLAVR